MISGSMGIWDRAATWVNEGMRREVFFFTSGGVELYGSLYAAEPTTRSLGVVVCGSWGVEADRSDPLAHGLAIATARLGGAGLVFHYPGFGDSYGDLGEVTMDMLAVSTADALAEATERSAATAWVLAGFTFGASVACLAQPLAAACGLVLMQPALSPSGYFERLAQRAERVAFGTARGGTAFGYPIPGRIVNQGDETGAAVETALSRFGGEGVAINYETPKDSEHSSLPGAMERVTLSGAWRFGSKNQPGMLAAATEWLERSRSAVEEGAL